MYTYSVCKNLTKEYFFIELNLTMNKILFSRPSEERIFFIGRYSQAKPTLKRVPLYRADLIAILLCSLGNIMHHSVQNTESYVCNNGQCTVY